VPYGLHPLPLGPGPSSLSRLPAGGAHLFAYFYLCSLPAANQRAGRGGGAGRGSGSGSSCCGRRFQSGFESRRARSALQPQPRPPTPASARPQRQGQRGCAGGSARASFTCGFGNLLYTLVSLLLIGIAAWGIGFGLISSLRVVGVVIAVGIFLFLIALVGLIGAVKHHQVLLFFYMIILLLVFVVQFSVSCACLALNEEQQGQLLEVGWNNTASARNDIQRNLNCCGFRTYNPNDTCLASCVKSSHPCSLCAPIIGKYAGEVLRFVGGIGLFFSFTEILGVWLTYRYRNQKDPRANPSAFL
uniref:Tetraspanin 13 n=1 Tax=Felis catus TaxID=9685 RepID=A0ABI7W206_FELCA